MEERKFAAFDIDGTLFRSGLYREVAYELMKMGALPENVLETTTRANREWRHRTHGNAFDEFEMLLVNEVVDALPQLRITDYEEAARRVIEQHAEDVYVYTRNLLRSLKERAYFLIAISGSQTELVEPFAQRYGFDTWVGQEWERGENGFFTGKVTRTYTGKDKILTRLMKLYNLTQKDSVAVGDSNGDVGMLEFVNHPIAFNPTHELLEKAMTHGWQITVERKNVMYTLQQRDGEYVLTDASMPTPK